MRVTANPLGLLVLTCFAASPMFARGAEVVLDESGFFRHYSRFGISRYSPTALQSEGEKVLGKTGLDRLQRDTERFLQQQGQNPAKGNWMEHALLPTYADFSPAPAPPPPAEWTAETFDDHRWVLRRRPFQGSPPADITKPDLGQYDEGMDLGVLHAYYRARLLVDKALPGDLTLTARYHGGLVVYVNGHEVARGHLPAGPLSPDPAALDYPAKAYADDGATLRERSLPAVTIPGKLFHPGVNVIAIEVHASDVHPAAMNAPRQPNWSAGTRPWPHARLDAFQLRASEKQVDSAIKRPAGVQVWVADVHHRPASDDFLPLGEAAGVVRWVGARSGTYAAQVLIGSDKPLTDLSAVPGELKPAGGGASIPASAITVRYMLPFPLDQWNMAHLGDERGLNATFPDAKKLREMADTPSADKISLFDQFTPTPPKTVPANTCRPVWLSLMIPADAAPGEYRGVVKIAAQGVAAVDIPLELTVADWSLPAPHDFQTLVGCEENPYGVARQYGVKLWSDEHFALLDKSLAQLARIGNKWLNVPVLAQTEYGNQDDSLIQWTRKKDQTWAFDYQRLDRYLDLCVKHCGLPRVINFVVLQGMKSQLKPPVPGHVKVFDEASGKTMIVDMDTQAHAPEAVAAWTAFAKSLQAHLKTKGLDGAMFWGHPLENEADPELKNVLAAATPAVFWIAGPHEMMFNGTYAKNEPFYKLVETIRYWGKWPAFRTDEGWRSKTTHLLNPRVGGTAFALHTTSLPFAFRVLPDHALAFGHNGFTRVGADEWAAVHFDGVAISKWQTGLPVLFMLWPAKNGAESSARFEMLLEGIQETEARIFIEQALERGGLPADLSAKARKTLAHNLAETMFFQGNSVIHAFEEYYYGWQERSARLYEIAAQVAKAARK